MLPARKNSTPISIARDKTPYSNDIRYLLSALPNIAIRYNAGINNGISALICTTGKISFSTRLSTKMAMMPISNTTPNNLLSALGQIIIIVVI